MSLGGEHASSAASSGVLDTPACALVAKGTTAGTRSGNESIRCPRARTDCAVRGLRLPPVMRGEIAKLSNDVFDWNACEGWRREWARDEGDTVHCPSGRSKGRVRERPYA